MPWVSLCTLQTKSSCPGPGMSSKKTTAILRPTASPSYILSSLPPQGLVGGDVQELVPSDAHAVHESRLEDRLHVVPPRWNKGAARANRSGRSFRASFTQEVIVVPCEVEAVQVDGPRPVLCICNCTPPLQDLPGRVEGEGSTPTHPYPSQSTSPSISIFPSTSTTLYPSIGPHPQLQTRTHYW